MGSSLLGYNVLFIFGSAVAGLNIPDSSSETPLKLVGDGGLACASLVWLFAVTDRTASRVALW